MEPTCFSCDTPLEDEGFFCLNCLAQVRCKSCEKLLRPNARGCIYCGTRLGETGDGVSSSDNGQIQRRNTIKLEETRTSRSLEAHFTDTAVESMSSALSAFIVGSINEQIPKAHRRSLPPAGTEIKDESIFDAEIHDHPEPPSTEESDHARILKIFRKNGERLELEDPRVKEKSNLDKAKRITHLFLYAHDLEGRPRVPRSELTDVLNAASVYDSNTRHWIKKAISKTLVQEGDTIGLNAAGRDEARKFLIEISDPSVSRTSGGERTRRKTATKSSKSDGKELSKTTKGSSSRPSGKSPKVEAWVKKWKESDVAKNVNGYEVIKDRSVLDKGIFALWAIRKAVGDEGKIVSRLHLSRFILEAFELKADERNLERVLTEAKGKVLHVGGTKFQIQPDGVKYVEEMIQIKKGGGASSSGKGTAKP